MKINRIVPIKFELVILEDESFYFRNEDGKWFRNLGDERESNFSEELEESYRLKK